MIWLHYLLYTLSFIVGIGVGLTAALSSLARKVMGKISARTNEDYEKIEEEKRLVIDEKIEETSKYYLKLQEIRRKNSRIVFRKKRTLKLEEPNDIKHLIKEVAAVFYPDSPEPLLELSVNDVFELVKRVTVRLDDTFAATNLSFVRYLKLSAVYMTMGVFNKINSIKNRGIMQFVLRIVNFSVLVTNIVSPVSLFKAGTRRKVNKDFSSVLIESLCKIIGRETACVYSKNMQIAEPEELLALTGKAE